MPVTEPVVAEDGDLSVEPVPADPGEIDLDRASDETLRELAAAYGVASDGDREAVIERILDAADPTENLPEGSDPEPVEPQRQPKSLEIARVAAENRNLPPHRATRAERRRWRARKVGETRRAW